jgi:glycosyltransferase involved in cell wall biosynthesis
MKPKILIIDNSTGITGAFKSIWNYSQLLRNSYEFHYCLPKSSTVLKVIEGHNVPTFGLLFIEIGRNWKVFFYLPQLVSNTLKLKRYCKNNQIKIVHVNDLYNMIGVLLKIGSDIKVVYHIRLLPSSYISKTYKIWVKVISKYADELIAVSQAAVAGAKQYSTRNIKLLYDSVGSISRKEIVKSPNDVIQFLYPSNYTLGKGQQYAIQAMAKVIAVNPHVYLTFVGGTFNRKGNRKFKEQLQNQINALKLTAFITLGEFENNLSDQIYSSDIVLNFSESESFSMVCLETLSYGTALIASDSGGPSELFENNISGILVPNKDVEKMATAMLSLAGNNELRSKLAQEGQRYVQIKFDATLLARQLDQFYKGLL